MSNAAITTGDICVGLILSRRLQRNILPNRGNYYRGAREQEDKFRFIAFLKTPAAAVFYDCLDETFDPDDLSAGNDLVNGG
jgi:hypothetical protein